LAQFRLGREVFATVFARGHRFPLIRNRERDVWFELSRRRRKRAVCAWSPDRVLDLAFVELDGASCRGNLALMSSIASDVPVVSLESSTSGDVASSTQPAAGTSETMAIVKRDERGRFQTGAPGPALKGGLHSTLVASGALLPDGAMRPAEREQQIVADLGGDVSYLRGSLVRRAVTLEMVADHLEQQIVTGGVLTQRDRQRSVVSSYLGVVDRLLKVSAAIGLERRQKPIDPLVAVRQAVEAANGR
jgi:hypothetical protein